MASRSEFNLGREGLVYATGYASDTGLRGPFKLGESSRSGQQRLKNEKAYVDPSRALCVRKQWQFSDRIWAEHRLHVELAQYRVKQAEGAESGVEWFDCSLECVEQAIDKVYRQQEVHVKAMARALASCGRECRSLDASSGSSDVLDALLRHRLRGKRTLADLVHDALYAPDKSGKIISELRELGLHCLPVTKVVVFRSASDAFDQLMKQLGFHTWPKQLGRIAGFDHDRTPIFAKDLKDHCRGFDVQRLLA